MPAGGETFLLLLAGRRDKLRLHHMDKPPHNQVTYSPGWTLIPTHYCRNSCGYCVFVERTGTNAQLLAPATYRAALAPHGFTLRPRLAVHQAWATPLWLSAQTLRAAERVRHRLPQSQEEMINEAIIEGMAAKQRRAVHV